MSSSTEYVVISAFRDKNTKEHYAVGSLYSSDEPERVKFLQEEGYLANEVVEADDNEQHVDERLKPVSGGYYELPNGDKVKGKKAALEKLKELDQE